MKTILFTLTVFLFSNCYAQSASDLQNSCGAGNGTDCTSLGNLYYEGKDVSQSFEDAKKYFERACELNDGLGCSRLGLLYDNGQGTEQSYAEAFKFYEKSCGLDNARGCSNLGTLYRAGTGVEQSYQKANEMFKKACDAGDEVGCFNYGSAYFAGQGMKASNQKALELFNKSCDANYGQACVAAGNMYRYGQGVKQSSPKAIEYYEKACGLGVGAGCNPIGVLYFSGRGVEKSNEKAFEYYTKACDLGYGTGCNNLGWMYEKALGIPQSYEMAQTNYEKGCSLYHGGACNNLGALYEAGRGVPVSYDKAKDAYEASCIAKDGLGCASLGFMYEAGEGLQQSDEKAATFYEMSCNLKNGDGCSSLGSMYEDGQGVPKSVTKAAEYYEKACNFKSGPGCIKLGRLYASGQGVTLSLEKAQEYFDKAKKYHSDSSRLAKLLTSITTTDENLSKSSSVTDKQFGDALLKLESNANKFSKEFNRIAAGLGVVNGIRSGSTVDVDGIKVIPVAKRDSFGDITVSEVRLESPFSVPVLRMFYVGEGEYLAELDFNYLNSTYSGKLAPKWASFLSQKEGEQRAGRPSGRSIASEVNQIVSTQPTPQTASSQTSDSRKPAPEIGGIQYLTVEDIDPDEDDDDLFFDRPKALNNASIDTGKDYDWLVTADVDESIQPTDELNKKFYSSNKLQSEQAFNEIKGKVVRWKLLVTEVHRASDFKGKGAPDDMYALYCRPRRSLDSLGVVVYVTPQTQEQKDLIFNLEDGDYVLVKGLIADELFITSVILEPAIVYSVPKNQ